MPPFTFDLVLAHHVIVSPHTLSADASTAHERSYPTGEVFSGRTAAFNEFLRRYLEQHYVAPADLDNINLFAATDVCFEARLYGVILFIMSIRPVQLELTIV